MKGIIPAPDLLTDSYPLDNSSATDLLDNHQRPRTDSSLFNPLISIIPSNNERHSSSTVQSPVSFLRNSNQQSWNEVNGDWRHQRNHLVTNDARGEPLWFDSDQIDVPLLTSNIVVIKVYLVFAVNLFNSITFQ